MTDLSGFTPASPLAAVVEPQSLRVPTDRDGAIAQAANILAALWDGVTAGLSPNVKVEVLRYNPPGGDPETMCRITPLKPDGVASTVANPGDWLAADSRGIVGMTNDTYAALYSKNIPIEWAATTTAPTATAESGLAAAIVFDQPSSANRPFTYAVNLTDETASTTTQVTPTATVDANDVVTLPLTGLTDGHAYHAVVTVNTQYSGVTASSAQTATFTAFDQPPQDPPVEAVE